MKELSIDRHVITTLVGIKLYPACKCSTSLVGGLKYHPVVQKPVILHSPQATSLPPRSGRRARDNVMIEGMEQPM